MVKRWRGGSKKIAVGGAGTEEVDRGTDLIEEAEEDRVRMTVEVDEAVEEEQEEKRAAKEIEAVAEEVEAVEEGG